MKLSSSYSIKPYAKYLEEESNQRLISVEATLGKKVSGFLVEFNTFYGLTEVNFSLR